MTGVDEEGGDIEEEGNADDEEIHTGVDGVEVEEEERVDEEENDKVDDQVQIGN